MLGRLKSKPILILLLIIGMLVAWGIYNYSTRTCCAPPPKEIDKTKLPSLPETREECLKKKGKWGKIGLSESEKCNLKTSDSGKACNDSSQCEGSCIGEDISSKAGTCSGWRITVGCYYFVSKGKVDGRICAD